MRTFGALRRTDLTVKATFISSVNLCDIVTYTKSNVQDVIKASFYVWLYCKVLPKHPYPVSPYLLYAWRDADMINALNILNFIPRLMLTLG